MSPPNGPIVSIISFCGPSRRLMRRSERGLAAASAEWSRTSQLRVLMAHCSILSLARRTGLRLGEPRATNGDEVSSQTFGWPFMPSRSALLPGFCSILDDWAPPFWGKVKGCKSLTDANADGV